MSKLEELIQQLCPDGVEWTILKEIANIGTGSSDRKNAVENGLYPFYVRSKDVLRINTYEFDETAIIIPGEGGIGEIFHYVKGKYALHQRAYRIKIIADVLNSKFVYYFMMENFKKFIEQKAVNATVTSIRKPMIEEFPIPFPPLPVQEEIVRLLDQLTETTQKYQSELEAELELRKKQYEEYLNSFFGYDFDDLLANKEIKGYQIMPLSELGTLTRGKRFVRDDVKASGQPCIHYGDLYTHYGIIADVTKTYLDRDFPKKMRYAQKGDVVIVGAGENDWDIGIGLVWNGEEPAAVHDACYILQHQMNPKYISYYLRSACYHLQIKKYVSTGKICSISSEGIGKALIPIPSLEKQQRIVNILDRMDKTHKELCQSIEYEIKMRKQQYEYYRNQLLDFKKKEE